MKLSPQPRVGVDDPALQRTLREVATQVNLLAESKLSAAYNASPVAPTTGTFALGDFVRNSTPSELGTAPNKYVVTGFLCIAGGSPGVFVQARSLTGN